MESVVNLKVSDSENNKTQYLYFKSHHPEMVFLAARMYAVTGGINGGSMQVRALSHSSIGDSASANPEAQI